MGGFKDDGTLFKFIVTMGFPSGLKEEALCDRMTGNVITPTPQPIHSFVKLQLFTFCRNWPAPAPEVRGREV